MNLILKALPKKLLWLDKKTIKKNKLKLAGSYEHVLVATKSSGHTIRIEIGFIRPKNNYTEFDIFTTDGGNYLDYFVPLKDLIAIHLIESPVAYD